MASMSAATTWSNDDPSDDAISGHLLHSPAPDGTGRTRDRCGYSAQTQACLSSNSAVRMSQTTLQGAFRPCSEATKAVDSERHQWQARAGRLTAQWILATRSSSAYI